MAYAIYIGNNLFDLWMELTVFVVAAWEGWHMLQINVGTQTGNIYND